MKNLLSGFLILSFLSLFSFGCDNFQPDSSGENADTCFYQIHVPADIDKPQAANFDTTIIRNQDCKVNALRLPGWGTETGYILSPEDPALMGKYKPRSTEFHAGEQGIIDITDLPEGAYTMHLLADGNGGGVMVRLK